MIGIRLANNTFFPVLDENGHNRAEARVPRKRLVLTTVADSQETVQIDLYRGDSKNIIDDTYLASLTVENIRSAGAGEPDIELVMGTDETGRLQARAFDRAGGSENSLSVSLQSLPEGETYETPDFSIGDDFATEESLGEYQWDEEAGAAGEPGDLEEPAEEVRADKPEKRSEQIRPSYEEPGRRRPVAAIVLLAIGVVAIAVLAYFLLREKPAPTAAAPASGITEQAPAPKPPAAAVTPSPAAPEKSTTGSTAPAATPPANPQVLSQTKDGVWYRIAFGDTLWDLAYSFYNNPRQFDRIAKKNNIADPNRIYGGNRIFIPLDQNGRTSSSGK